MGAGQKLAAAWVNEETKPSSSIFILTCPAIRLKSRRNWTVQFKLLFWQLLTIPWTEGGMIDRDKEFQRRW